MNLIRKIFLVAMVLTYSLMGFAGQFIDLTDDELLQKRRDVVSAIHRIEVATDICMFLPFSGLFMAILTSNEKSFRDELDAINADMTERGLTITEG